MTAKINRRLASLAVIGLIAFAAVPAANAQWFSPWRAAASPAEIALRLQAQGYVLIAPLQRRPSVYLADVSAGPGDFQRLVIDAGSGEILQRFIAPARRWGPQLAVRNGEFTEPMAPGNFDKRPRGSFSSAPDSSPAAKSANDGPTDVHIPTVISPYGAPEGPSATKSKPKSGAPAHKILEMKAGVTDAPPMPPSRPHDAGANGDRDDRGAENPTAYAPGADQPRSGVAPTGADNAAPVSQDALEKDASKPSAAAPEAKPEARTQAIATTRSSDPASQTTASEPPEGKSKVSIVPAPLFE